MGFLVVRASLNLCARVAKSSIYFCEKYIRSELRKAFYMTLYGTDIVDNFVYYLLMGYAFNLVDILIHTLTLTIRIP